MHEYVSATSGPGFPVNQGAINYVSASTVHAKTYGDSPVPASNNNNNNYFGTFADGGGFPQGQDDVDYGAPSEVQAKTYGAI